MCGIAGALNTDGSPVDPALLRRMADRLVHRGPDGEGFFREGGLGLAHRRLAIVDLEGGAQPMEDPAGRCVVSFNGEIFNHLELRASLEEEGEIFRTHSDTEALLLGFAARGEAIFAQLDGQFACAIWDRRNKRLVLARDPVGIKPLYWGFSNGTLLFASELKAIEAVREDLTIDPRALDLYLSNGYVPAPRSIYREVNKLLPGQCLALEARPDARPELRHFLAPHELYCPGEDVLGYGSSEELKEDLDRAVGAQLMSDVPLGAFLSGGTDSTAVLQSMCAHDQSPRCFTIAYDADTTDLERSREAARILGARLETRVLGQEDLLQRAPALVDQVDEPMASDSLLPTDAVCALAREEVTVALAGDGGDEILGGYRRFFKHLNSLASGMRPLQRGLGRLAALLPFEGGSVRRLQGRALSPAEQYARYHLRSSAHTRRRLYRREFLEQLGEPDEGDYLVELHRSSRATTEEHRIASVDFQSFLPEHVLAKVDRLSMRHSLEVRVPILSPRLIRRAYATLPDQKFLYEGRRIVGGKKILKDLLRERFCDDFVDARKRGFSAPLRSWIGRREVERMREVLLSSEASEVFDRRAMERYLDKNRGAQRAHNFLFTLLILGLWMEGRSRLRSLAGAAV